MGVRTSVRAVVVAIAFSAAASALPPARAADEPLPAAPAPGDGAAGTPAPRPEATAADRRWVRSLWFDLAGRGPTLREIDDSLALEPAALVDRFLADPATWEAWLERELYYYLLIDRFRPVSDRVKAIPGQLARGEITVRDATREIVVSAEFNTRNPGNDTFVTVVLEQLHGTVVQEKPRLLEAGKKMYDGYAARLYGELGRTQADVVRIVLGRKEFCEHLLGRHYRAVFGVAPPAAGLAADAARLLAEPGSYREILRGWVLSDAYRARTAIPRPKSELVFIRTLFTDLVGREPTFEEFRNCRNAFTALSDPQPVRLVIARLLLESGRAPLPRKEEITRPAEWVRGEFLRLLGRAPTPRESDAFVATLGEYGCEPSTIVLALATCPEYQFY